MRRDKWREKNYIKGLTLTRKSCEGLSLCFFRLGPNDLNPAFQDFRLLVEEYEELAD